MKGLLAVALLATSACEESAPATIDATVVPGVATRFDAPSRATIRLHFQSAGGLLDVELDCHPSDADVDAVGFRFAIDAPALGLPAGASPDRAGYLRVRADVPAGAFDVALDARGGGASCTVTAASSTGCGALTVFRSVETGHDHVAIGAQPVWEPFPVSGDHYPMWVPWSRSYDLPIRTGYLLHNLEHGGIVFSYRCLASPASPACTAAAADLAGVRTAFEAAQSTPRAIDTPDPDQPAMYAARAWRWGLSAACFDAAELAAFAQRRLRHGREDFDVDFPTAFDPTR